MIGVARTVEGLNIAGVLSQDNQKARDFAKKYNLESAYDSYDDLLDDDRIDTIYVALPNNLHFECALHAVRAGKSTEEDCQDRVSGG